MQSRTNRLIVVYLTPASHNGICYRRPHFGHVFRVIHGNKFIRTSFNYRCHLRRHVSVGSTLVKSHIRSWILIKSLLRSPITSGVRGNDCPGPDTRFHSEWLPLMLTKLPSRLLSSHHWKLLNLFWLRTHVCRYGSRPRSDRLRRETERL